MLLLYGYRACFQAMVSDRHRLSPPVEPFFEQMAVDHTSETSRVTPRCYDRRGSL